jgi:hypothetical protein
VSTHRRPGSQPAPLAETSSGRRRTPGMAPTDCDERDDSPALISTILALGFVVLLTAASLA